MTKLKPCPFCGNDAIAHHAMVENDDGECFIVCRCGAGGPECDTEQAAIEAWNTRKEPSE